MLAQAGAQGAASPLSSSSTSPSDFPAYRFVAGKSIVYHVAYQSVANADLRALFEGQNAGQAQAGLSYALSATLDGEMEVTTTRVNAASVENFYSFRSPVVRLVVNGNPLTGQAAEVTAELARGFLAELTPEGRVNAIYLSPEAGKFSQDFARTLLAALQFVLPASSPRDSGSWTTTEADRNGTYIARYRMTKNSDGESADVLLITKSKLRYLPEPAAPAGEGLPGKTQARKKVTPKMNFEARFQTSTGQLTSLNGTEVQDTSVQETKVAHSETTLRVTRASSPQASPSETERLIKAAAVLRENSSRPTLFAQRSPKEIEDNIQRTELGSATPADLLTRLNAVNTDSALLGKDPDKRQALETPVYLKFKALVYVHPEACAQLGQVLAKADFSSATFRILSGALGAVAHREAQAALVQAISARPQDSAALTSLIATLGSTPHPTSEAEKALRESALTAPDPNIAGTALLALGAIARSLARAEPARSNAIVDFLLQRAAVPGPSEQTQATLQALGNAASSRGLPVLTRMTTSDSPAIRAAAVDALRNIPQPQVDPLLRHALATDAEPQVRLEAAFALGFRKPNLESFNAQKKALATEGEEKVRGAILDNLAKMHHQFPEVRSILARSAKDDPSEYVRKEAAGLLGQLRTDAGRK
jgi:hypothetical protein